MEASMTVLTETPATPDLAEVVAKLGLPMRFSRDEEIHGQDEPVARLFKVVSGVVRTSRFTVEGRRQIGEFYYAGDVFGLEPGPLHRFAAEALTDCEIAVVKRSAVLQAAGEAAFNAAILEATRRELDKAQEHLLVLGRKSAVQRVASFLMGMAGPRASAAPSSAVELPMGRQDMADYLGLTIETVSRTLTQLQGDHVVEFPSLRRFHVREWPALEALAA
jgi:CRP/FNR family nitrogen fixation transcriptional regulator